MDRGQMLRRLVHLATPLFLVYYALPDPLWEGAPDNQTLLIFLLLAILIFEALRLRFKWKIIGIRDYEYERISAAAWAAIGLTVAFLFFPFELVAPVLIGMAFVDPLIGELRRMKSNLYPVLPITVYLALVFATLAILTGWTTTALIASVVATVLAISFEKWRTKYVDDDFLMIVVPLLGIAAVYWVTSSLVF